MLCASAATVNRGGWIAFWAALAGVLMVLLLINLYRGPTCETKLMTAVQTETLHSLHRLKSAMNVMDQLASHIRNVQGGLSREDIGKMPARRLDDARDKGATPPAGKTKAAIRHEKGSAHLVLFGLLTLYGLLAISGFIFTHVFVTILGSVTCICIGIFVIVSLAKQHRSDMPHALQIITWISLGYVGISFIAGYVIAMISAFKNPGIAYNQWELFKSISSLSPWENPLLLSYDILTICGAFFLGLPGLLMLKRSGPGIIENPVKRVVHSHRSVVSTKSAGEVEDQVS
jgi:hypothetical protein